MKSLTVVLLYLTLTLTLLGSLTGQAAAIKSYGTQCGGTFLSVSVPKLSLPFRFSVQNDDASTVLVGVGLTPANVMLGPAGCQLLVTPQWVFQFPSAGGVSSGELFRLPSDPNWIGLSFFVQAVSNDSRGLAWTGGIEAVIGT